MGQLIWNVITAFLAVGAIAVAVIFYFRQKKEKNPTWARESHGLVGPVSELGGHLKITYDAKPVTQVTSTRIAFWNAGRDSILKTDIAKAFLVQFPKGIEILECRVLNCSRPEIEFQTRSERGSVGLEFKFLGHGDGAHLEVLHTGPPDVPLEMSGSLVSDAREARLLKAWPLQTGELELATGSRRWVLVLEIAGWVVLAVFVGVLAGGGMAAARARGAVMPNAVAAGVLFYLLTARALRRRKKGYPAWLRKAKT